MCDAQSADSCGPVGGIVWSLTARAPAPAGQIQLPCQAGKVKDAGPSPRSNLQRISRHGLAEMPSPAEQGIDFCKMEIIKGSSRTRVLESRTIQLAQQVTRESLG